MTIVEKGTTLIRDCEGELQKLVAAAAAVGEYDAVICLTSWAKHLAQISSGEDTRLTTEAVCNVTKSGELPGTQFRVPSTMGSPEKTGIDRATQPRKQRARKTGKTPKKAGAKDGYPKFLRQGDDIVKLGWSRKERKEYRHKSPKRYLELVASALDEAGKNGALVSTENILPVRDPETGADVPGYQAYLCIAILRHRGLVEQHGRQGYTVPQGTFLIPQIPSLWESLPDR